MFQSKKKVYQNIKKRLSPIVCKSYEIVIWNLQKRIQNVSQISYRGCAVLIIRIYCI